MHCLCAAGFAGLSQPHSVVTSCVPVIIMMPAYACSWVPADEAGVLHKHLAWLVKILLNMIPYQLPDMDLQASDTSFLPQELSCVSVTISLVSNVCITAVAQLVTTE
eukprot:GHUV01054474.1.p1 GENE.GHUV01054474.1~~GHUV01054474.1.p1  ORF type:complete len:107 (+),score=14.86 GHUV01054474.1:336-656(+)